ncbi:hypothetical protein GCM10009839_70210 [Catenulispora yoronensis]|uniref:Uncharacterized protein n=1 Tax=Catenulispora yoronensis TaxID=450799 RepID=A0ABP5GQL6_9ACTN
MVREARLGSPGILGSPGFGWRWCAEAGSWSRSGRVGAGRLCTVLVGEGTLTPTDNGVHVTMTVDRMHDLEWTERLIGGRQIELANLGKAVG